MAPAILLAALRAAMCLAAAAKSLLLYQPLASAGQAVIVSVSSPDHSSASAIVSGIIPSAAARALGLRDASSVRLTEPDGSSIPAQLSRYQGHFAVTFVTPAIRKGSSLQLNLERVSGTQSGGVRVTQASGDISVEVDGKPFTRYTTSSGPNKPFFYPILTPDGDNFTRRWPMEDDAAGSHDHPHQRGLWFTHGSVNGIDFWSEGKNAGKTVAKGFSGISGGTVFGEFHTRTVWISPAGSPIANDSRFVRIYDLGGGARAVDFEISIRPVSGPLLFGDSKEGV
ncbi:MAG TPA: DUF6807 family protein, partial [Chthonomonadales bacterium]|nr:DUF6807 family protein [Chthonomonadales bacterium]